MRTPLMFLALMLLALISATVCPGQTARSVSAVRAQQQALRSTTLVQGEIFALATMRLVPRVSGSIARIHVKEGDMVEFGAVLVSLFCPDLQAELVAAQSAAIAAAARIEVARSAVAAERQRVVAARARVRQSEQAIEVAVADLKVAEAEMKRSMELFDQEAATVEELEQAGLKQVQTRARKEVAVAAAEVARAGLAECQSQVAVREAELAQAKAVAAVAEAGVQRAQVYVDFTILRNPFPQARITEQLIDPGNLVLADTSVILELMNIERVRIRFPVSEAEASLVRPGTALRIVQPRSEHEPLLTQVTRVTGAVDTQSRTMAAEVELQNGCGRWLPGGLCQVEVTLVDKQNALTIPTRGLIKDGADAYVWLAVGAKAVRRSVQTGIDLGRRVEILSGLKDGDLVIIAGQAGLREGAEVQVTVLEN